MSQSSVDPFAFEPIQLVTESERRGMHRLDYGEQIQRPDVVDDLCQNLLLAARIDRVVHGFTDEGNSPATLIIFGFRFHGLSDERRFKQARICITFQDALKRDNTYDPEVTALWPNSTYVLGEPTVVQVESTKEGEIGADVTAGAVVQGGAHTVMRWEQKHAYQRTNRSTLTGSITINTTMRKHRGSNMVRVTLTEDPAAASGIITDLRIAVLLERPQNQAPEHNAFLASVKLKAKGDFRYNFFRGIRDLTGFSTPNGPVRFQPGVNYLRPSAAGDVMGGKLSQPIDANNLNVARLDDLAGALSPTVLGFSNIPPTEISN